MRDFKKLFEEKGIDYIQFQFTTISGDFKAIEFPSKIWDDMKEGTGIDGSSLGFLKTEQSDMQAIPDLNSFAILPWNQRIGRFICDLADNKGKAHPLCPRGILKKVLENIKSMGYECLTRPELEWYFINDDSEPIDRGSYLDLPPKDIYHELRRQISDDMIEMGIGVKVFHHEGGPGQQEIEFLANNALYQADNVQTSKMIIKIESDYEGIISSFMPKPFPSEAGSGLHLHQYLNKNGQNAFTNENKGVSDLLRHYIGGIQKHVRAISAILNPITNSYKRLIPNREAPVFNSWGIGNRTALIRVPGYETSARIEYRAGDAAMNIYLGTAVLIAAGFDGIKNKIEPNVHTTKNVDTLDNQERKNLGITKLPEKLEESLISFEEDKFFENILGKELKKIYLDIKYAELQEYEIAKANKNENEWEFRKYINI
jgi:glutamine synthetase